MAELGLNFFFGSKSCADPDNTFDFGHEMRVFFERQQQRMGFDDDFLADHFAICSRPAALRLMKLFHQGKSLKPVFVKRIQELLCRHRSVNFINFPIETFHAFKKTFLVADCQTRMFGNVIQRSRL